VTWILERGAQLDFFVQISGVLERVDRKGQGKTRWFLLCAVP
jgi:hypothetical protein